MSLILVLVIIVLAAAGGFLGDLLELAGWLILILVLFGAFLGGAVYFLGKRLWERAKSGFG